MTDGTLQIQLLGNPMITLGGVPVTGIAYTRAAALVYYLAATGQAHTRETVAGLLWSEISDEQARKNLRDVLTNLRRALGAYLVITRQTVGLNPDASIFCDSRSFEAHVNAARRTASSADTLRSLQEAAALYRGDFCAGLYIAAASVFEEWMLAERERFRHLAMHTLHLLSVHAAEQGAYLEGIDYATRLLAMDALREDTHRQLMLLLALSGQRGAALSQYETLCRTLRDELGVDPTDETTALYEQILAGKIAGAPDETVVTASPRPAHNLPALFTSFIGRAAEVAQIVQRLRAPDSRLLTVVGPGGVGKTTLALHAAHQLVGKDQAQNTFAHGVYFVSLVALDAVPRHGAGDPTGLLADTLATRIADALRFRLSGSDTPYTQLCNYLRTKHVLLVLDNFEHLLSATEVLIDLLHQAPQLSLLVTSRVRLNIRGEQVIELSGLPVPASQEMAVPSVWDSYDALQLFRRTAEAVQPRFEWTAANKRAALRICRLVDGLPLGIELAASMVRLLPCTEIARELERNLNVLQDTRRDLPERHQSLRAVFDHSWRLLSADEQRLLRQLTVFRGGFTRAAVEAVWVDRDAQETVGRAGTAATSLTILKLLMALVDHSLVRSVSDEGDSEATVRYDLLEVVRQYAAEHLRATAQQSGSEQMAVRDRHCWYYLEFVRRQAADLRGNRQQVAMQAIHQEIENIRSAWYWAIERGHAAALDRAMTGMFYFHEMRSWFQEGATVFAAAAERLAAGSDANRDADTTRILGKLRARQGWFTFQLGRQVEAQALLEQSLALLRPVAPPAELVFPLNRIAAVTYHLGDYAEARQYVQEALDLSLAWNDRDGEAVARTILGQIAYFRGDYLAARRHCWNSLAVERELGNRWGTVFNLIILGRVAYALGEYDEARRQFHESLMNRHALRDTRGTALCLNHLGETAEAQGDPAEARRLYEESLALFNEIGNRAGAAMVLNHLGHHALARQDVAAAQRSFHAALQTAWQTQALPHALAALVGMAIIRARDAPEQALELAILVEQHPAATQESKDRAAALRRQIMPGASPAATQRQDAASRSLDEVVARIVR